jgi:hypothetical protein
MVIGFGFVRNVNIYSLTKKPGKSKTNMVIPANITHAEKAKGVKLILNLTSLMRMLSIFKE